MQNHKIYKGEMADGRQRREGGERGGREGGDIKPSFIRYCIICVYLSIVYKTCAFAYFVGCLISAC